MQNFTKSLLRNSQFFLKSQGTQLLAQPFRNQKFFQRNWKLVTLGSLGFSLTAFQFQKNLSLDGFYEITVEADLKDGEKKAVQVGPEEGDKVLVTKVDGQYYCTSNACSHFGFGLDKGVIFDDKVTCPLHMAQFSVKTGEHEYGPVFKGLETFEIVEKNGQLHIKVSKDKLNKSRTLPMSKKGDDKRRFLIVGGGVAGLSAAETLRQSGFEGEITIVSSEKEDPYDRTILSKFLACKLDGITVRTSDFLKQYDINLIKQTTVERVDTRKNYVQTTDGQHMHYEKLLVATGATPRLPPIENNRAKGVVTVRTFDDIQNIKEYADNSKNILVVGASFIGLESASSIKAYLKDKDVKITVCDVAKVPYERVLGDKVGGTIQKLHQDNGINFKLKTGVKKINTSSNGQVESVELSDGSKVQADLVVFGTGVAPNTQFLSKTFDLNKDGGVPTDIFQKVNGSQDVYAAGDIAAYPWWYSGQQVRIEHYNEAIHQGHVAALNMLGKGVPNDNVPFFWTRFHNKSLVYAGHAQKFDDVFIDGDLKGQKFTAYYFWNNKVVAAASLGVMNNVMVIQEAMKQNVLPSAQDIKKGKVKIEDIQKLVAAKGHNCKCKRGERCGSKK